MPTHSFEIMTQVTLGEDSSCELPRKTHQRIHFPTVNFLKKFYASCHIRNLIRPKRIRLGDKYTAEQCVPFCEQQILRKYRLEKNSRARCWQKPIHFDKHTKTSIGFVCAQVMCENHIRRSTRQAKINLHHRKAYFDKENHSVTSRLSRPTTLNTDITASYIGIVRYISCRIRYTEGTYNM